MRFAIFAIAFIPSLVPTSEAIRADDSCVQPSPEEMAAAAGVELPTLPWHVANIWWQLENPVQNFTSLEIDFSIDRDVPQTYNLYIAPCGVANINGLQFYGGVQTNINGWAGKESRKRVHRGRGVIFSRWSSDLKTKIGLDHVKPAGEDCLVESAGYEGEFASVRRPMPWKEELLKKGTYTWSVTKGETIERNGAPATWFICLLKDHANDSTLEVGSLLFEGQDFTFWGKHSAFVEIYSTAPIPRSPIPKVNVTFGRPRINGQKAAVQSASAYYPDPAKGAPGSPDCSNVRTEGESCIVEVGAIFKRDESRRRHELNP